MNVSLTQELERFVNKEVKGGLYQSASEVVRAGLRRLREDKLRKPRFVVSSVDELEDKLNEGIEELRRGQGICGETVFQELKQRSAAIKRVRK